MFVFVGEIGSLMMHKRTWGTVLSTAASRETIDRDVGSLHVRFGATYHFRGGFLETPLRGQRTGVETGEWVRERKSLNARSATEANLDDRSSPDQETKAKISIGQRKLLKKGIEGKFVGLSHGARLGRNCGFPVLPEYAT